MKKRPSKPSIPTLRNAYQVSGFRVRARIDSYDELRHPAFVLTLDRRAKKRRVADAETLAALAMVNVGDGFAILVAATGKSISIFKCAA